MPNQPGNLEKVIFIMPNHICLTIMLIAMLACYPLAKATISAQAGTVRPTPTPLALPAGLTRVKVGNEWDVKRGEVIAVADWLYFRQGAALWKSDGTVAGTAVAVAGIEPLGMTACNGQLYFRHNDQLWRLQPTDDSPQLVKDDVRGPWQEETVQCSSDKLFFVDADGRHGQELWQIDGQDSEAALVKDINPGRNGSGIKELIHFRDQVFFTAHTDQMGDALWVSNGTLTGTLPLTTLPMATTAFASVQETLFFLVGCCQLWRVTADLTGAELVKDFATEGASSVNLFPARTRLYLTAIQPFTDTNVFVLSTLWGSNGHLAEMRKIHAYVRHNLTFATQVIGDRLLFEEVRYDGALFGERRLLISDGTITATTTLPFALDYTWFYSDIALPPFPDQAFAVYDRTLWRTDGTITNTIALTTVRIGPHTLYPWQVTQFGDRFAYTQPSDHLPGIPLWISDGTPAGSQLLVDFAPALEDYGAIHQITNVNGNLFFFVDEQAGDYDGLWVYRPELTAESYQHYLPLYHIVERGSVDEP